jgi:calcium-translocating P-type ATPase
VSARAAETDVAAERPRVVHSLPGRIRVHVPGWSGEGSGALEQRLSTLAGVRRAHASAHTRNVLVEFDRDAADERSILSALGTQPGPRRGTRSRPGDAPGTGAPEHGETPPHGKEPRRPSSRATSVPGRAARQIGRVPRHVVREVGKFGRRARISVPGLDRDPRVAGRVVERLGRMPGVTRVTASQLTGRVLVEFSERQIGVEEILAQVARLDLPELPGEDAPSHPLDPVPLIQSTARVIGSGLGLGLLAVRRARGQPAQGSGRAAKAAGALGIVEGMPPVERPLEDLLGRNRAQIAISGLSILSLTLAANPLGLTVAGAGALRLMTTVRARRSAWERYEQRVAGAEPPNPGAQIELEAGERAPVAGSVVSGFGTAISRNGELVAVRPGARLDAGARLAGGPVIVELEGDEAFIPQPRETPPTPTIYDRYLSSLPSVSLGYAALLGVLTRSAGRALTGLLLVNPRAALIGAESADNGAAARVLRHGVTVVGSREKRPICRPDALIVESPRALTSVLELAGAKSLRAELDERDVLRLAAGVAAAAGSPWGEVLGRIGPVDAVDGTFDGSVASAEIDGERWLLGPRHQDRGTSHVLELREARRPAPVGTIELRPAKAAGLDELLETCRRREVALELVEHCSPAVAELAGRVGVKVIDAEARDRIRELQSTGGVVAVLSDSAHAAQEFAECDLAIALTSGRGGRFGARADLLAADLTSVCAVIEAGVRRDAAVRDSVISSALSNVAGAAWGLGGNPRFERGAAATHVAALGAIGDAYLRLRGGARARSVTERLSDPQPERFGRQSIDQVLAALDTREHGLTTEQARARELPAEHRDGGRLAGAIADQLRSPLTGILLGAAGLSLALGAVGDVAMIAAVIVANTAVGAWQERQAGRAAEALDRLSARTANVLRDGEVQTLDADLIVPGDVILLGAGDRVPADARLIESEDLEVDEAPLTGESFPVPKTEHGGAPGNRVVLEGSDVTVGTGRAVVVAVGPQTRIGATAAAIALHETGESPLGQKLSQMFRQGLPVTVGGGLLVTGSGLLWGRPLVPQLALGASIAVAAIPEGLPLLAGVAEAAIARRLADRNALVRRLAAVEALGRVDVACTDKTGTLTEGHPALTCVADVRGQCAAPVNLDQARHGILEAAALASPHPDGPTADSHPTDTAVVEGAERAGLTAMRDVDREDEEPFDPARGYHATRARGRVYVKGAVEVLAARCDRARQGSRTTRLTHAGRRELLTRAEQLAAKGLRVLMVAEGPAETSMEDPEALVALGYVGISDPLRANVPAAVARCHAAGVRVVMLTGDHPATATAIAREAGLSGSGEAVLTGDELGALDDEELDRRLEAARVIARITPLDKLRIVEALQRRGHVVAMTGDGVNDAPALRLADVGVAMGRVGTDVAREAADVVLADDDFSTLVETLVEGRGFWHNIRRALGLLLGGNLGELGMMVAASVAGRAAPLNTRQVLAVNLVTDVLPALAVAVQEPEHRNLAGLAREGTTALDAPLRRDIVRRAIAAGGPATAAYAIASRGAPPARAQAVAYTSVVCGQLAQTLDLGRGEDRVSPEVGAAVAGSLAFVVASLAFPPFQQFLGLAIPSPLGLALCGGSTAASWGLGRALGNGPRL